MMGWLPRCPMPQEDDHSQTPGFRPGMDKPVTTASVPIFKLPKIRLTEAVEFVESKLDVTMTAPLDSSLLAVTAWCSLCFFHLVCEGSVNIVFLCLLQPVKF